VSLARGLERRLERLIDGIAARLFRGQLHPVELGTRLVREADLALQSGPSGPVAPNDFEIALRGDPADEDALQEMELELGAVIEDTASERGWRLEGRARVRLVLSDGNPAVAAIRSRILPGPLPPWSRLLSPGDGRSHDIGPNRAIIGRAVDCDVHLPDLEVSRHHALIWREAGKTWLRDLGSANGSSVNGVPGAAPAEVADDDLITLGDIPFVFRLV
jgi:hypothetical protein